MPTTTQTVAVGLATMGLVAVTYGQFLPRAADLEVGNANDRDALRAEKAARWTSAALVVGIAVLTRDAKVAIMGALAVVAFSWQHRLAIHMDPQSATIMVPSSPVGIHTGDGTPAGYTPSP